MVENRPFLNFLAHAVLILGVAVMAFPVYIALIASTRAPFDFQSGLLPLVYAHLFSLSLMRDIFAKQIQLGKMPEPQLTI